MIHRELTAMQTRRTFAAGVAATALAAGYTRVAASQATPPAGGMTVEETQTLLGGYLDALFSDGNIRPFLADDASFVAMETGDRVSGADAVVDAIATLHTVQFNAQPELKNKIVGAGTAALEVLFVGTQTADFGGIPSTGASVSVPYSAFYTTSNGLIEEIRLYGLICGLVSQLSAAGEPVATPVG